MITNLIRTSLILSISFSAHAITLEQAFESALQKNEGAGQARERVIQAEEQVSQAKGAIYPNLSLNASHMVQPPVSDPLAKEFFPETQTTANLTLTQPLFRGLREFAGLRQRQDLLSSQRQLRISSLASLYEQTASAFLDVLAIEQDLRNLSEQKKLYGERVRELQARGRRGESRRSDALIAQSTEAGVDAEIRMAQAKLKTARERFGMLTALSTDSPLQEKSKKIVLGKLEDYISRIDERPDVKSAKALVEAADEGVSFSRGAHWPTADLIGNYYLKRPDGYLSDVKWDVQLRLSLPIFEGGLRTSQTREAVSKRRESELELNRIRRQAEADIRSLYETLKMRAEQLSALKTSSELAEQNYQTLQKDFRRGLVLNLDVQMAMTEYRVAKRNYDQARYAAQLEIIRLETASAMWPASLLKEM